MVNNQWKIRFRFSFAKGIVTKYIRKLQNEKENNKMKKKTTKCNRKRQNANANAGIYYDGEKVRKMQLYMGVIYLTACTFPFCDLKLIN